MGQGGTLPRLALPHFTPRAATRKAAHMAEKTITIRGKEYPKPHLDRMKRKQAKALRPLLERLQNEDLDALWDVTGSLVPTLPKKDLDDLEMGECKSILSVAGVAKFDTDADAPEITAGESSASTSS